ncbi:unnamed protein product [Amoebophrya sp. A25]|nr:unnamed protein product [Amoebophrya sp. A25]|eukprot:GSA25T00013278001.1
MARTKEDDAEQPFSERLKDGADRCCQYLQQYSVERYLQLFVFIMIIFSVTNIGISRTGE